MLVFGNINDISLKVENVISHIVGKKIEIIKNKFGKPYLKSKDLYFNISHCKDFSVAIIEKNECGIDIEQIRKYNDLMALKVCSNAEYKFLNKCEKKDYYFTALWVLKEAYLKYLGTGISMPMNEINFVHNNNLVLNMQDFKMNLLNYKGGIIAICRK